MIEHLKRLGFTFDPPLEEAPATDREDPVQKLFEGSRAVEPPSSNPGQSERAPRCWRCRLTSNIHPRTGPRRYVFAWSWRAVLTPTVSACSPKRSRPCLRFLISAKRPGYDHHGYTGQPFARLTGTIPASRLETLLKDLRAQPAGWFASRVPPQDEPAPMRNVIPIRIIEVLNDTEPIAEIPCSAAALACFPGKDQPGTLDHRERQKRRAGNGAGGTHLRGNARRREPKLAATLARTGARHLR